MARRKSTPGTRPALPDFVLADIDRVADEIGASYKAALREAFGLPAERTEAAGKPDPAKDEGAEG